MAETRPILYAFWASSCSWRARAVLRYKNIPFEERTIDIVKRKHLTEEYKAMNPIQKVPSLVIDGETIVESMAIIQYLEDTRPNPPLMPTTPLLRARVREICEIVVSGIQPLQNIGLKNHLSPEQFAQFREYWTVKGLETLEIMLKKSSGHYCVGNNISLADICLVPQVFNATRLNLKLEEYGTLSKLYEKLLEEDCIRETHPLRIRPPK